MFSDILTNCFANHDTMELNSKFFRPPPPTYSKSTHPNISEIKLERPGGAAPQLVPCYLRNYEPGSSILLVFFHGTADDLGTTIGFLDEISKTLRVNVVSLEFPGYGVYEGVPTSAEAILIDADALVMALKTRSPWGTSDRSKVKVIVMGRSMGSGPATYLAAKYPEVIDGLVLMSPFKSFCNLVKDLVGWGAHWLVKERFNNIEEIQRVKCNIALIHGAADTFIPPSNSEELKAAAKAPVELYLQPGMTHSEFSVPKDIIEPLQSFLKKLGLEPTIDSSYRLTLS